MDWFDIGGQGRVKVITEQDYRGIMCKHVKDEGWKIVLGMEEYLFPNFQEAKFAIDQIHAACVKQFGAVKLKNNLQYKS